MADGITRLFFVMHRAVDVSVRYSGNLIQYACLSMLLLAGLMLASTAQAQQVGTLSISPDIISAGAGATGTVTLTAAAPTGGATVTLSSNNGVATVPPNVLVQAGQNSATFLVTTSTTVSSQQNATITAAYNTSSKNAGLIIIALPSHTRLSDVSLAPLLRFDWNGPTLVLPSYYSWTLSGLASGQTQNTTLTLTSIPVTVGTSYTFTVTEVVVTTDPATGQQVTYRVDAPSVPFTPQQVVVSDNQSVDARYDPRYSTFVNIDHNFGSTFYRGGLFMGNSPDPARMGRSFLRFPATPLANGTNVWCASVNAYFAGALVTNTSGWTVGCQSVPDNAWTLNTLTWDSAPPLNPATPEATCTVTYNTSSPVPAWCHLAPASVLDNLAASRASCVGLTVTTETADQSNHTNSWLYFAKKEYDSTKRAYLLFATGAPTVELYVSVSPTTIHSNGTATGTVYLDGPASSPINVSLSSTTGASVPASVTIPTGQESANFTITAGMVMQNTSVTITAGTNLAGNPVTTTLTVQP